MTTAAEIRASLRAALATAAMSIILTPIALSRFGLAGVFVVWIFAASILLSLGIAAIGATILARRDHLLSALFVTSGVRMVVPLAVAAAIVLTQDRFAPLDAVVLVVPIYLVMLAADISGWIQHVPLASAARNTRSRVTGGAG
jgi:hypothetical protein